VHDLYFEPKYDDFRPRTIWSLSNAFTSAFKEVDPIPQFKAAAKLGDFLEGERHRARENSYTPALLYHRTMFLTLVLAGPPARAWRSFNRAVA
jgi:hypothetical protein